jgi:hypothetical protein
LQDTPGDLHGAFTTLIKGLHKEVALQSAAPHEGLEMTFAHAGPVYFPFGKQPGLLLYVL